MKGDFAWKVHLFIDIGLMSIRDIQFILLILAMEVETFLDNWNEPISLLQLFSLQEGTPHTKDIAGTLTQFKNDLAALIKNANSQPLTDGTIEAQRLDQYFFKKKNAPHLQHEPSIEEQFCVSLTTQFDRPINCLFLAALAFSLEKLSEFQEYSQKGISLSSESSFCRLFMARHLCCSSNYSRFQKQFMMPSELSCAIQMAREVIKREPANRPAWDYLCRLLNFQKYDQTQFTEFFKGVNIETGSEEFKLKLIDFLLYNQKNYVSALTIFQEVVSSQAQLKLPFETFGLMAIDRSKTLSLIEKVLEDKEGKDGTISYHTLKLLGLLYISLNKNKRGIDFLNKAYQIQPEDWESCFLLGYGLLQSYARKIHTFIIYFDQNGVKVVEQPIKDNKKHIEDAVKYLKQADRLKPKSRIILEQLGKGYCQLGKISKAQQLDRSYLSRKGGQAEYYQILGVILFRKGQFGEALFNFKKALRLEPNSDLHKNNQEQCCKMKTIYLQYKKHSKDIVAKAFLFGNPKLSLERCCELAIAKHRKQDEQCRILKNQNSEVCLRLGNILQHFEVESLANACFERAVSLKKQNIKEDEDECCHADNVNEDEKQLSLENCSQNQESIVELQLFNFENSSMFERFRHQQSSIDPSRQIKLDQESENLFKKLRFQNYMLIIQFLSQRKNQYKYIARHYFGNQTPPLSNFKLKVEKGDPNITQRQLWEQGTNQVLHFFECLIRGILELQEAGILHSDLKLRNILRFKLTEDKWEYKIIDFDYAFRVCGNSQNPVLKQTKKILNFLLKKNVDKAIFYLFGNQEYKSKGRYYCEVKEIVESNKSLEDKELLILSVHQKFCFYSHWLQFSAIAKNVFGEKNCSLGSEDREQLLELITKQISTENPEQNKIWYDFCLERLTELLKITSSD